MSKETHTMPVSAAATTLIKADQVKALDNIVTSALSALGGEGSFENTFAVADAMNQLKEAITPEMMKRFMSLQNTSLGFRTDRDQKSGKAPYGEDVVKECVIEATLRGVLTIGNQMNILAGRCYITKEGFEYKLKKLDGLQGFKPVIGIPKAAGGGAIVPCQATWLYKGKPDRLECEIPIRVNDGMGADAILGKAQRKFFKRVFEQITGTSIPDGEVGDEAFLVSSRPVVTHAPKFHTPGANVESTTKLKDVPVQDENVTRLYAMLAVSNITPERLGGYLFEHDFTSALVNSVERIPANVVSELVGNWTQHSQRILNENQSAASKGYLNTSGIS